MQNTWKAKMKCKRAAVLLLDCISFGSLGKLADADKEDFAFPAGHASLTRPTHKCLDKGRRRQENPEEIGYFEPT
jgi:hypothetical protein